MSGLARMLLGIVVLTALASVGCRTEFRGNAHFSGGPRMCYERCRAEHMQMASFVFMGDFASGCVCELDPARAADDAVRERDGVTSGGEGIAAVAGVWQQMLADEEAH